jgi:hypothetical protein
LPTNLIDQYALLGLCVREVSDPAGLLALWRCSLITERLGNVRYELIEFAVIEAATDILL